LLHAPRAASRKDEFSLLDCIERLKRNCQRADIRRRAADKAYFSVLLSYRIREEIMGIELVDKNIIECFKKNYNEAEMVLIGIGSEFHMDMFDSAEKMKQMLEYYNAVLDRKNYFIITSLAQNIFENTDFNRKRIVNPIMIDTVGETEEKQWELYNKWLSGTLNHRLMIIELGEGFNRPNIFRWPFEKILYINQKSVMYRINQQFYQLPENISERAFSIACNSVAFLDWLMQQTDE